MGCRGSAARLRCVRETVLIARPPLPRRSKRLCVLLTRPYAFARVSFPEGCTVDMDALVGFFSRDKLALGVRRLDLQWNFGNAGLLPPLSTPPSRPATVTTSL